MNSLRSEPANELRGSSLFGKPRRLVAGFHPSEQEFIKLSRNGNLIPVYKEIAVGGETPVSAFRKIEGEHSFLLESVEGGEKIARYSFLGTVSRSKVQSPKSFNEIRRLLKKYQPVKIKGLPRFYGGLVGYISYDAVRQIESKLVRTDKNPDDLHLPLMQFLLAETVLVFDHLQNKILIVSNSLVRGNPQKSYRDACRNILELENRLKQSFPARREETPCPLKLKSNLSKSEFEKMVRKAKEHIRAGDIIQVVLSQRFETKTQADPFDLYCILRQLNPSPYLYYFKSGDIHLVGSSPEVMVRLEAEEATLRPIAGTRPRGKSKTQDKKLERELLASQKERAEHVMLVDLGRNDLGRVCRSGSVKVTEQMTIEKYSHVMHIVSNLTGRLRKDKDAVDLLMACFPAGTVAGAPKVRAMEIIDELEKVKRGPYAGCVGYFSFSGDLDTAITIRTILVKGQRAYVQAGAGIVADSVPAREYEETVNKARALLQTLCLTSGS